MLKRIKKLDFLKKLKIKSNMKYNEPEALNGVAEFHRLFKLPDLKNAQIPSKERIALRISLLEEELKELKTAIDENDLVEVADAFADIQYVLSGAILEFGMGSKFKDIFDEVQRSNMSKTCKSMDEALKTQVYYKEKRGVDSYIEKSGNEFLVYRIGDGKVLKSVNYSAADLERIIGDNK